MNPQGWRESAGVRCRLHSSAPLRTHSSIISFKLQVRRSVESFVTPVLISIRSPFGGLTLWSTSDMTENDISDIFVQLVDNLNELRQ